MANAQAVCTSFKAEVLKGEHSIKASGGHSLKFGLYYSTGSLGAGTTVYSTTSENTGTNYTAGGKTATDADPATSGAVGYWTPGANVSWGTLTMGAQCDAALLYNDTHATNAGIAVYTFGATQVTAGDFTLTMPTNNSSSALLRIT